MLLSMLLRGGVCGCLFDQKPIRVRNLQQTNISTRKIATKATLRKITKKEKQETQNIIKTEM